MTAPFNTRRTTERRKMLSGADAHRRQRELVRASLVTCPGSTRRSPVASR